MPNACHADAPAARPSRASLPLLLAAALGAGAWSVGLSPAGAQELPPFEPGNAAAVDAAPGDPNDPIVELHLPEDMPFDALVGLVSRELGISLINDESLAGETLNVTLRKPLRRSQLRGFLSAALRSRDRALVATSQPGLFEIRPLDEVRGELLLEDVDVDSAGAATGDGPSGADLVTRVFTLKRASADRAGEMLRPMMSSYDAIIYTDDATGRIVASDTRTKLAQAERLLETLDAAPEGSGIKTLEVQHADPVRLARQIDRALKQDLRGAGSEQAANRLSVTADARTRRLIVVGPAGIADRAAALAAELDTPGDADPMPVRRYKLTNTTAAEMLRTLRQVASSTSRGGRGGGGLSGGGFDNDGFGAGDEFGPGGYTDNDAGGFDAPFGGDAEFDEQRFGDDTFDGDLGGPEGRQNFGPGTGGPGSAFPGAPGFPGDGGIAGDPFTTDTGISAASLVGRRVTLAADANTNSIIVVADPTTQAIYADLIEMLDERRPQVQIEATLVSLDTTDAYTLGVEFGSQDAVDDGRLVTFGSFGISGVDPASGALTPTTGAGFTAALLGTDFADIILRAFANDRRARVLSAPTLLVNDNETGKLESVREEPTTEISQGEVTTQISFKEFVEAGTTIEVTPNISDGGYLQLKYKVVVNSFLPQSEALSAAGIPPPRQTDEIASRVTIPDGHTVVVGGLTRRDQTNDVQKIPVLGSIPVLGALFRNTDEADIQRTLFVFLRPTILSDDDFGDLRTLSLPALEEAGLAPDETWDEPELMD